MPGGRKCSSELQNKALAKELRQGTRQQSDTIAVVPEDLEKSEHLSIA